MSTWARTRPVTEGYLNTQQQSTRSPIQPSGKLSSENRRFLLLKAQSSSNFGTAAERSLWAKSRTFSQGTRRVKLEKLGMRRGKVLCVWGWGEDYAKSVS